MKRYVRHIFVLAVVLLMAGCASTGGSSAQGGADGGLSLVEAIDQSAEEIAVELPKGTRVAIAAFSAEHENLSNYIMDELAGALTDGSLEVADRRNLAYVYKELNFQMSGDVSDETAVSIGKFLGAKYVITGQFIKAGDSYRYRLAGINVETAVQESSTRLNVSNGRSLQSLIADVRQNPVVVVAAAYGTQPKTAGAHLDRGISFASQNDFEQAIAEFTQAIRLDPNLAAAYFNRGLAYKNKQDYDQAIADYTQALRIDPNDAAAYNNRGGAYFYKQDYDRAIADCTQAIRLDPNNATPYGGRAYAYYNKKDYDRARADFTKALQINPNMPTSREFLEKLRSIGR
jgi:tetratricopeptide (TPR) repeat protein